jgi:hypothetical protein
MVNYLKTQIKIQRFKWLLAEFNRFMELHNELEDIMQQKIQELTALANDLKASGDVVDGKLGPLQAFVAGLKSNATATPYTAEDDAAVQAAKDTIQGVKDNLDAAAKTLDTVMTP